MLNDGDSLYTLDVESYELIANEDLPDDVDFSNMRGAEEFPTSTYKGLLKMIGSSFHVGEGYGVLGDMLGNDLYLNVSSPFGEDTTYRLSVANISLDVFKSKVEEIMSST